MSLSEGWLAPRDRDPTADDVAAHLADITATEPYTIPSSIYDEVFAVAQRLGISSDHPHQAW